MVRHGASRAALVLGLPAMIRTLVNIRRRPHLMAMVRTRREVASAVREPVALAMIQLLLFLALFLPLIAQSAWIDASGKPIPDTESMRSAGNYGVQVVLTPDDKQFRQSWKSTNATPKLSSTDSVRLGSSVAAVIIFHGCSPDAMGVCHLFSQFILESPDGVRTAAGGGPVWTAAPLAGGLLQLGQSSMSVRFDKTDPVGVYKVIANVTDKVSGRTLTVMRTLEVTK
jgi:hypothetical protein